MTTPTSVSAEPVIAARRHRVAAAIIDNVTVVIAFTLIRTALGGEETFEESSPTSWLNLYAGNPGWVTEIMLLALTIGYFWSQHAVWGQTLGKRLCRLKVVAASTGEAPGVVWAGVRTLVYPALSTVPYVWPAVYVVMLWSFADRRRRGLHDVAARTIVVDLTGPGSVREQVRGALFRVGLLVAVFAALVLISVIVAR
ncbi:hypothetical protein DP939_00760 [Spongiactinospora rosea]|uniref:RDD domain-containing protein n=1 Tax=Spongiactinospora rosea TaxID=2248750 RepID=A0A366M5H1_9ACTN|nr:RDD family protein [Spongiactinospora rosea]RBQ21287.1 hypothetical protein DP939_00760 [Spongiactinospora rosea]